MRHAGVRSVRIAFEAIGAADAPVVLVAGGISAHRHVAASARFPEAGWANDLVGAGRALDPARHRIRSEEHTSELQSLMRISYAVFCLKKKTKTKHSPKHKRSTIHHYTHRY